MKRIFSRLLVIVGLALVAAGRKLDKPAPPVARRVIDLPRRNYRPAYQVRRVSWLNSFVPCYVFG